MQKVAPRSAPRPLSAHATSDIRAQFLTRATDDLSALRPVVARSWWRSRAAGVKADADHGFIDEGHVDERTLAIAERHLRELDDVAADIGGYVNLTSPNGSLVKPKFLRDEIEFPSGYSLLESSCGSSGEGVAIEEGRGVWLAPEEHFRDDMRRNWCFASLIRDPFHERVRAVVGLTLPTSQIHRLDASSTLLMLEGVTARIEREIEQCMSSRERALLREYMIVSRRRSKAAVVVTNGKHSFMNEVATSQLEGADLSIVAGYAKSVMASRDPLRVEALLAGPGSSVVEVTAIELGGSDVGAVAVVRPRAVARTAHSDLVQPSDPVDVSQPDLLSQRLQGQSESFMRTLVSARQAMKTGRSVLIVGEPGVGKRRLADAIASVRGIIITLDGRDPDIGRAVAEARHAEAMQTAPLLVLAHADELAPIEARDVAAQLRNDGCAVILLAESVSDGVRAMAEASAALEIRIPSLRRRREDIPLLASAIAAEIGTKRLSRKVITALTKADWPGNVAQLRQVVSDAAKQSRGIEIEDLDMPESFQQLLTGGRLSRLEDAELAEIRGALREARGNRRVAAESLEIGRSTLYRRMDYFRSRGFDI